MVRRSVGAIVVAALAACTTREDSTACDHDEITGSGQTVTTTAYAPPMGCAPPERDDPSASVLVVESEADFAARYRCGTDGGTPASGVNFTTSRIVAVYLDGKERQTFVVKHEDRI